jgi:hypothetical protein
VATFKGGRSVRSRLPAEIEFIAPVHVAAAARAPKSVLPLPARLLLN